MYRNHGFKIQFLGFESATRASLAARMHTFSHLGGSSALGVKGECGLSAVWSGDVTAKSVWCVLYIY